MKKTIYLFAVAVVMAACSSGEVKETKEDVRLAIDQLETNYRLTKNNVELIWTGKKLIGEHTGSVEMNNGTLELHKGHLHGKLVMDMRSIICTDITDSSKNADLVAHLKSVDFFDSKNSPMGIFTISEGNIVGNEAAISGNLNIKGHQEMVESIATIVDGDSTITFTGNIEFDRTKFGIVYKSASVFSDLGDKFINDDITIAYKVEVKR